MGVLKYPRVRLFDGLAHDLELYQGKGTGAQNIKCYMDNCFTSVKLLLELKEIGILASGTIRGNRLAGCVLRTDEEMKKEGRGSYDERVSVSGDVALVRSQDNGVVNMASTRKRWRGKKMERSFKAHVDMECPEVILDYNKYMGEVDKLDFIMSLYAMRTRTEKVACESDIAFCFFCSL
ncbi:hypothetical protein MRX96_010567 [Rhipicephalus microplus]